MARKLIPFPNPLEPLRQGVRVCFAALAEGRGLKLHHDHGSQFVADDYQPELAFLGIASSPAFVREPEGNGCVERFIRTLKENLLWVRRFDTIEELRLALHAIDEPTINPGTGPTPGISSSRRPPSVDRNRRPPRAKGGTRSSLPSTIISINLWSPHGQPLVCGNRHRADFPVRHRAAVAR